MWFELDNRRVGYGYAQTHSDDIVREPETVTLGPIGARQTFHAGECVAAAVRWARSRAEFVRIFVPAEHPSLTHLLNMGFRIVDSDTFCSTRPLVFTDPSVGRRPFLRRLGGCGCNAFVLIETVLLNTSKDERDASTTFEGDSSRRAYGPPRGPSIDREGPTCRVRTSVTGNQRRTQMVVGEVRPNAVCRHLASDGCLSNPNSVKES
jgi:hypothetical protein